MQSVSSSSSNNTDIPDAYSNSSFWSRFFFLFPSKLMKKAFKEEIVIKDVPTLPEEYEVGVVAETFDAKWEEKNRCASVPRTPFAALLATSRVEVIFACHNCGSLPNGFVPCRSFSF